MSKQIQNGYPNSTPISSFSTSTSTPNPNSTPLAGRMNVKLLELEQENANLRTELDELKRWKSYVENFLTETLGYQAPAPDWDGTSTETVLVDQKKYQESLKSQKKPDDSEPSTSKNQKTKKLDNTDASSSTTGPFSTPLPENSTGGKKPKVRKSEPNKKEKIPTVHVPTSVPSKLPVKRKLEAPDDSKDRSGGTSNSKSASGLVAMASYLGLKQKPKATPISPNNDEEVNCQGQMEAETLSSPLPSTSTNHSTLAQETPGGTSNSIDINKSMEVMKADDEGEEQPLSDTTPCDICNGCYSEDNNEMIFCDTCNVCVHQACYGVKEIPTGEWQCQTCAAGIRKGDALCRLCTVKGGAMIKVNAPGRNSWAHVSCTWWIPEVKIRNPDEMDLVIGIPKIDKHRWNLKCCLCGEGRGTTCCIQCTYKKCCKAYHVTCAYKNGLRMDIIDKGGDEPPVFMSYCTMHINKGSELDIQSHAQKKKRRKTSHKAQLST